MLTVEIGIMDHSTKQSCASELCGKVMFCHCCCKLNSFVPSTVWVSWLIVSIRLHQQEYWKISLQRWYVLGICWRSLTRTTLKRKKILWPKMGNHWPEMTLINLLWKHKDHVSPSEQKIVFVGILLKVVAGSQNDCSFLLCRMQILGITDCIISKHSGSLRR